MASAAAMRRVTPRRADPIVLGIETRIAKQLTAFSRLGSY